MYGYRYGFYGFDWTYILLIIGMLLSLAASAKLRSTFAKYRGVRNASGLTGAEAAARILRAAGITDVQVRAIREVLRIIMIQEQKRSVFPRTFTDRLPWQQLEWRPMSAATPSSTPRIMRLLN